MSRRKKSELEGVLSYFENAPVEAAKLALEVVQRLVKTRVEFASAAIVASAPPVKAKAEKPKAPRKPKAKIDPATLSGE